VTPGNILSRGQTLQDIPSCTFVPFVVIDFVLLSPGVISRTGIDAQERGPLLGQAQLDADLMPLSVT
jgi:hypothetical protein